MKIAVINEIDCVGCGKCLSPCPVDAIIGAPQFTHTVFTQECIGCGLCVAPCPMDCIQILDSPIQDSSDEKRHLAAKAKYRYTEKQKRLQRLAPLQLSEQVNAPHFKEKIKEEISNAVERTNKKRAELLHQGYNSQENQEIHAKEREQTI